MNIQTIIALVVLALILFFAIRYIVKEKKKGNHCIGCPFADSCTKYKLSDFRSEDCCTGTVDAQDANQA